MGECSVYTGRLVDSTEDWSLRLEEDGVLVIRDNKIVLRTKVGEDGVWSSRTARSSLSRIRGLQSGEGKNIHKDP